MTGCATLREFRCIRSRVLEKQHQNLLAYTVAMLNLIRREQHRPDRVIVGLSRNFIRTNWRISTGVFRVASPSLRRSRTAEFICAAKCQLITSWIARRADQN